MKKALKKIPWGAYLVLAVALLMCAALWTAKPLAPQDGVETLSAYSTFYPIYALADEILADVPGMEHHLLIQPQTGCLRSVSLSDWDLYTLAYGADLVIAGGRGLEAFEAQLSNMGDGGPAVVTALYNLALYNQEDAASGEDAGHLDGANPHLYMSIEGSSRLAESIAGCLMALDPQYEALYNHNLDHLLEKLDAISQEARGIAGALSGRRAILMNEAAIYVAQDYGLEVAYWYDRESGAALYGTELSDCLAALEQCGAKVVLLEKQAPVSLVEALEGAGFTVAKLETMTMLREDQGADAYFEAHLENARALAAAFQAAREGES